MALVGQTVFHGRIYKAVHSVDFRLEFIVYGADVTQASILFMHSYIVSFHINSGRYSAFGLSNNDGDGGCSFIAA